MPNIWKMYAAMKSATVRYSCRGFLALKMGGIFPSIAKVFSYWLTAVLSTHSPGFGHSSIYCCLLLLNCSHPFPEYANRKLKLGSKYLPHRGLQRAKVYPVLEGRVHTGRGPWEGCGKRSRWNVRLNLWWRRLGGTNWIRRDEVMAQAVPRQVPMGWGTANWNQPCSSELSSQPSD